MHSDLFALESETLTLAPGASVLRGFALTESTALLAVSPKLRSAQPFGI